MSLCDSDTLPGTSDMLIDQLKKHVPKAIYRLQGADEPDKSSARKMEELAYSAGRRSIVDDLVFLQRRQQQQP